MASMQFGAFLPNFGPFADIRALASLGRLAEENGWDGFFVWDHIQFDNDHPRPVADPWIALALVAAATRSVRIGALMTPLARRRPWKVARETASIDNISQGRLIFGAGLGYPTEVEFGLFGEESDNVLRAQKLDEGLAILDGLWSGRPFKHIGACYTISKTRFLPTPVQRPRPPVWIAGWWPHLAPFRRAARWDGVFPESIGGGIPSPGQVSAIIEYVRRFRAGDQRFDMVLAGRTATSSREAGEFVRGYASRGATWWLEKFGPDRGFSIEAAAQRIRAGPPRHLEG